MHWHTQAKDKQLKLQLEFYGTILFVIMVFQKSSFLIKVEIFESDLIKELFKIAGVKKVHTTPYHPQGNGQCERFNSTLCNMLGTLSEEEKSDWKSHLGCMTHAYNCI